MQKNAYRSLSFIPDLYAKMQSISMHATYNNVSILGQNTEHLIKVMTASDRRRLYPGIHIFQYSSESRNLIEAVRRFFLKAEREEYK